MSYDLEDINMPCRECNTTNLGGAWYHLHSPWCEPTCPDCLPKTTTMQETKCYICKDGCYTVNIIGEGNAASIGIICESCAESIQEINNPIEVDNAYYFKNIVN